MKPEWVEAGGKAVRDGMPRVQPKLPWDGAIGDYFAWTEHDVASAVIAAAEPLIRADERAKAHVHATGTSTGDGPCCECCYDVPAIYDLRAQIAAEVEAATPNADRAEFMTYADGYRIGMTDAARIARGES